MSFEKIIWISRNNTKLGGTTNNFNFLLNSNCIDYDAVNINVQLINAIISPSSFVAYFERDYIKIMIDFNTYHNQSNRQNNNYIIAGIISPMGFINFFSESLQNHGPIYKLSGVPNSLINIYIACWDVVAVNEIGLIDNLNTVPKNVLLCLKFTYDKIIK